MSTATYDEAAGQLGLSASTIARRVRLTAVPTWIEGGKVHFDLETLEDAWQGRRDSMRPGSLEGVPLSVTVRPDQRAKIEEMTSGEPNAISRVTRRIIDEGLRALS